MNAGRVPFEAPKERSRVCFGGFRPTKPVEGPRALARGAPQQPYLKSGIDFPGETFRVLKDKKGWGYGKYRNRGSG